ncbi:MlaD family protein [Sunxiuqinia dokdonensis]|nr:MlaD family protein [Sunxiuqinia dokdonensis]
MSKIKSRPLKLGMLVSIGLLLFVMAVYYLGSKQNLFSSTFTITSHFSDVKGLVEGNKVRYSGISVGTVSNVTIISDSTILVEMLVNEKVREFIRKDSRVEIGREGLMGSKMVIIHPGSPEAGSVEDQGQLASINPVDVQEMVQEARKIIDDSRMVSKALLEMSEKINNGDGDLARLINDNSITTKLSKAGDELLAFTENAKEISTKVNRGEGDLGRLVNDTAITYELTFTLNRLRQMSARADSVTMEMLLFSKELNEGNGVLNRLVYDEQMAQHLDTTVIKAGRGIEEVARTAETIRESWILNLFSGRNKKDKQAD